MTVVRAAGRAVIFMVMAVRVQVQRVRALMAAHVMMLGNLV
jgi:hypothetical protein